MLLLVWGCLLSWGAFFESLGERGRFARLLQARFRGKGLGPTSNMGEKEASGLAALVLTLDPRDVLFCLDAERDQLHCSHAAGGFGSGGRNPTGVLGRYCHPGFPTSAG